MFIIFTSGFKKSPINDFKSSNKTNRNKTKFRISQYIKIKQLRVNSRNQGNLKWKKRTSLPR